MFKYFNNTYVNKKYKILYKKKQKLYKKRIYTTKDSLHINILLGSKKFADNCITRLKWLQRWDTFKPVFNLTNFKLLNLEKSLKPKLFNFVFEEKKSYKKIYKIFIRSTKRRIDAVLFDEQKIILNFSSGIFGKRLKTKKAAISAFKLGYAFQKALKKLNIPNLKNYIILNIKGRGVLMSNFLKNIQKFYQFIFINRIFQISFNGTKLKAKKRKRKSIAKKKRKK